MTYLLDTNAVSELMRGDPRVEKWMVGLRVGDRIVTCTIVRGEILFGIERLPESRRRAELERVGLQFLNAFICEPIPEEAGDIMLPSNLPVRGSDWHWTKMIFGLLLRPLHLAQLW